MLISKISGQLSREPAATFRLSTVHPNSARRTRRTRRKKSASFCVFRGQKNLLVTSKVAKSPNAPHQRPRASDARHGTETQSRGSLHPVLGHSPNLRSSLDPVKNRPVRISPVIIVELTPQENSVRVSVAQAWSHNCVAAAVQRERCPIWRGLSRMVPRTNKNSGSGQLVGHGEKV